MGDRYDREQAARRKQFGRMLPPEPILRWGIGDVAPIGHNGGPPLEDHGGFLWRKHVWTQAYKKAWETPSMAVLKFRVARAEAAGLTYREYMLELLDSGRHLQKEDTDKRRRAVAKPSTLGANGARPASVGPTASAQSSINAGEEQPPSTSLSPSPIVSSRSRKAMPTVAGRGKPRPEPL